MKLLITIQNGSLAGQRRELTSGSLTIGREAGCGLTFDLNLDRLVSKRHAYFQKEADGFYLVDAGSTNGTFVNGARVERVRLKSGDAIQFGGVEGPQAAVIIEQMPAAASTPSPPSAPTNLARPAEQPTAIRHNSAAQPPRAEGQTRASAANYVQGGIQINAGVAARGDDFAKDGGKTSLGDSLASRVLFNPDAAPPKNRTGQYVGGAIAVVAALFLMLIVTAITLLELGPVAAVIATVVAFAPVAFYLLPLLWLDRYDPEPPLALALAFAWGALVAVVFSFVVNSLLGALLGGGFATVVSAPVFEEASKGLAVVLLLVFWRREFDGIVDGIVYAGVVALGFAAVENVLYYGRNLIEGGFGGLAVLFVLRGIMSPFAHVIFTSMTGIGCGIARETHNKVLRFAMPIVGYAAAVVLHFIWNALPTFFGGIGFLVGYFIFEVPFFLLFVGFAIFMLRRENKILRESLQIEVAKNVISGEQLNIAASTVQSFKWLMAGFGAGKFNARRKFLRAVSKLGLAWWHVSRAQAAGGQTMSFRLLPDLEREVLRWRELV